METVKTVMEGLNAMNGKNKPADPGTQGQK
jgi:hypothetical protein